MTTRPPGPPFILSHPGTPVEAWILHPDDPPKRCRWPTAALAQRVLDATPEWAGDTRAILDAYIFLLSHPAGTESAVQRLRALRRAERSLR
jgi:hypothetical protein